MQAVHCQLLEAYYNTILHLLYVHTVVVPTHTVRVHFLTGTVKRRKTICRRCVHSAYTVNQNKYVRILIAHTHCQLIRDTTK